MNIDTHVHTRFSPDSWSEIPEILAAAKRRGLDAIAITDHDTLDGYRAAVRERSDDDVRIIPGVERTISAGQYGIHIIGLYVESLPSAESLEATISDVKEQGGRVIIPHPYRRGTGLLYHLEEGNVSEEAVADAFEAADYVELINWKDPNPTILRTIDFLRETAYPVVAGSDSHVPETVGSVFTHFASSDLRGPSRACAHVRGTYADVRDVGPHLVGHDRSPRTEGAKRRLKTLVASVLNLIPGPEPNRTLKRLKYHAGKRRRRSTIESQMDQCWLVELRLDRESNTIVTEAPET